MNNIYTHSSEARDRAAVLPPVAVGQDAIKGRFQIKRWHVVLVALVVLAVLLIFMSQRPVFPPICACLPLS